MSFSEDASRRKQVVWPSEVSSPRGPYSKSVSGPYSSGLGAFVPAPIDGQVPGSAAVPARFRGFSGIFDDLKTTFSTTWGKLFVLAVGAGVLFWGESKGWFDSDE